MGLFGGLSKMNHKFISVIIVSGRNSGLLKRTISKLIKTKYKKKHFEIIVVRDSKSDNFNFNKYFPKFKIKLIKKEFEGVSKARNFGAKIIFPKSDVVAFIDDDATPKGDWISEINKFFDENPEKNILAGEIIQIKNKTLASKYSDIFSAHDVKKYGLPIGTNMAFRSFLIKEIFHDERFKRGYDDFDYAMQLILNGNKIGYSKKVTVEHKNPISMFEIFKKRFQSSKYSILFFNKYKQNPFHIEDILIIILFLSFIVGNLLLKYLLFLISIGSFIVIFYKETKKRNVKILEKIVILFLFVIVRVIRLVGKLVGIAKWGALKCRRS
jgi:GT2 family glycosyltransferase